MWKILFKYLIQFQTAAVTQYNYFFYWRNNTTLTYLYQQKRIFLVWDHVIRCPVHGNFSQLHTFDGISASLRVLVNACVHVHKNEDHPENKNQHRFRNDGQISARFHSYFLLMRFFLIEDKKWYEDHRDAMNANCTVYSVLTWDGLKNMYVWVEPCITLCSGLTCGCPSNRKWAESRFVHGLLAT